MSKVAERLNLQPHEVGFNYSIVNGQCFDQKYKCFNKNKGPGDLEVHRGRDGRLYIVDTARLFCPENPKGI